MNTSPAAGDTLRTISGFGSTAGQDRCHRQFVGPTATMAAGNVFDTSATYKAYAQGPRVTTRTTSGRELAFASCRGMARPFGIRSRRLPTTRQATMEQVASQQGVPRWRRWNRLLHDRRGRSARGGVRPQAKPRAPRSRARPGRAPRQPGRYSGERDHDVDHRPSVVRVLARRHVRDVHAHDAHSGHAVRQHSVDGGGDGTTNDRARFGANRAFASLVTALNAIAATDWAGTTAGRGFSVAGPHRQGARRRIDCLERSPFTDMLSRDHRRPAVIARHLDVALSMCRHRARWLRCLTAEDTYGSPGSDTSSRLGREPPGIPCWPSSTMVLRWMLRFDRVRVEAVEHCGGPHVVRRSVLDDANGPRTRSAYTNCVAVGWTGTGAETTVTGFTKYPGPTGGVRLYNCTAHGCAAGFASGSGHGREELRRGQLRETASAARSTPGRRTTPAAFAADAPVLNPRNSVARRS